MVYGKPLIVFTLLIICGIARAENYSPPLGHLSVVNDLPEARVDEVLDLPLLEVLNHAPGALAETLGVRDETTGDYLPTQIIDEPASGRDKRLLILLDIGPSQSHTLNFFQAYDGMPAPTARVYGRFVPERKDDFAWENEKIAFRMYGPKLQQLGEIGGSGVDVWSKHVNKLIINDWYKLEAEAARTGKEAVHTDRGQGIDCYVTKDTRGCGGVGIWTGDKLANSGNFSKWKVLANGPIRGIYELEYAPWDGGGVQVSETKRITLDAGTHFNHLQSTFHFQGKDSLTIAGGIQLHPGGNLKVQIEKGTAAQWEPADMKLGMMGTAIVLPADVHASLQQLSDHALFLFPNVKSDQPISFFAGAGWSQSPDVPDQATWNAMVDDLSAKLRSPLKTRWP
jgi:pectinesterase